MQTWTKSRKAGLGVFCALLLMCLLVPGASAGQSAAESARKKSTTAKKTQPSASAGKRHSASGRTGKAASASKAKTASSSKRSSRRKSAKLRGQQKIDSERALAIQQALVREHYLTGEPAGTWNQASEEAMRRYQADHGWQSKTVPDSRALISLGLGPSKDHLLNPESAMTTVPDRPKADSLPTTSHTGPASAEPIAPSTSTSVPSQNVLSDPQ